MFNQNWTVLAKKYSFLIRIRATFRTAIGTAISYVTYAASWKNGCQNFSNVHRSRKHWKCKYLLINCEWLTWRKCSLLQSYMWYKLTSTITHLISRMRGKYPIAEFSYVINAKAVVFLSIARTSSIEYSFIWNSIPLGESVLKDICGTSIEYYSISFYSMLREKD